MSELAEIEGHAQDEVQEAKARIPDASASKMEVRVKMARYYANGLSPSQIVEMLSKEYPAVSERTIWRYWSKRNEWLPSLTSKDSLQNTEAIDKLLLALEESRRMAYATYVKADNASARVGAIGKYQDAIRIEAEFRQSLGILPSRPLEIDAKGLAPNNLVLQLWMPRVEAERQAQMGRMVMDPEGRPITVSNPVAVSAEVPKLELEHKKEAKTDGTADSSADTATKPACQ